MDTMTIDQEQLLSNGNGASCCRIEVSIRNRNKAHSKIIFYVVLVSLAVLVFSVGFLTSWVVWQSVDGTSTNEQPVGPTTSAPKIPYNKGLHDEHCPVAVYRDDMLNVHLIPHSHDDVGWLKTADQYFYGDHNDIQNAGVQYIIDSVVQALAANPERRFVQVEMAFLSRWWHRQHNETKELFRKLLRNGQIEIIGGGWSMSDEATTNYNALIDQQTHGFSFINKAIDPDFRPFIGWQIDPFGHARETASLFAEMGMNGLFFARVDYQDLRKRNKDKATEMIWRLRPSTPEDNLSLFTSVLADGSYCTQPGFDWNYGSNDPPIMDDEYLEGYNVDQRISDFENNTARQAIQYQTNHILAPMGCDFNYGSASSWFMNMDALIRVVNSKSKKVRVFYSTPSCYARAVHESIKAFPSKTDDFFPYADSPGSYWTGYFTSRPGLKLMVRNLINAFGTSRELLAITKTKVDQVVARQLHYIWDSLGILQHHDGISGTSKQAVTDDDRLRMDQSLDYSLSITAKALANLVCNSNTACKLSSSDFHFCPLINETYCPFTEQRTSFSVVIFDRLSDTTSPWLRIPLKTTNNTIVTVTDAAGKDVIYELMPILDDIKSIPTQANSKANVELLFQARAPPMGTTIYFVELTESLTPVTPPYNITPAAELGSIDNGALRLTFNDKGSVMTLENLQDNVAISFKHMLAYYLSEISPGKPSGAYRFNPNDTGLQTFPEPTGIVVSSKQLIEIHQQYSPWAKAILKLYKAEAHLSVQWIVGPIPTNFDGTGDDKREIGREVVSLFSSSIDNQGFFYTDSNGREMIERRTDFRPTWKFETTQNISQNYYPVVSRASTKDSKAQLTIVTDRAQGASGFRSGSLEFMVHRRITEDDNFGVGEPLMETEDGRGLVLSGHHWIMFNSPAKAAPNFRKVSSKLMFPYTIVFTSLGYEDWKAAGLTFSTYMGKPIDLSNGMPQLPLPQNIHLLTLEPDFMGCSLLLRLEHLYEAGEDPVFSKDTTIDLMTFVKGIVHTESDKISIEERSLGANMPVEDNVRLQWTSKPSAAIFVIKGDPPVAGKRQLANDWHNVVMRPMNIRTFCVIVQ